VRVVGNSAARRQGSRDSRLSLIGRYRDVDVKPTTAGFGWLEGVEHEMWIAPVPVDCVLSA